MTFPAKPRCGTPPWKRGYHCCEFLLFLKEFAVVWSSESLTMVALPLCPPQIRDIPWLSEQLLKVARAFAARVENLGFVQVESGNPRGYFNSWPWDTYMWHVILWVVIMIYPSLFWKWMRCIFVSLGIYVTFQYIINRILTHTRSCEHSSRSLSDLRGGGMDVSGADRVASRSLRYVEMGGSVWFSNRFRSFLLLYQFHPGTHPNLENDFRSSHSHLLVAYLESSVFLPTSFRNFGQRCLEVSHCSRPRLRKVSYEDPRAMAGEVPSSSIWWWIVMVFVWVMILRLYIFPFVYFLEVALSLRVLTQVSLARATLTPSINCCHPFATPAQINLHMLSDKHVRSQMISRSTAWSSFASESSLYGFFRAVCLKRVHVLERLLRLPPEEAELAAQESAARRFFGWDILSRARSRLESPRSLWKTCTQKSYNHD